MEGFRLIASSPRAGTDRVSHITGFLLTCNIQRKTYLQISVWRSTLLSLPPSSGMLGLEGSHPISLSLQIGRKKKSLWKELRHDYLMMQSQFCIQGLFFSFRTFLFLIFPAKLSCLVYSPNLLPWPMAIRHLSSENNCWLSLILQVFSYFHSFITVILVKF